MIKAMWDIILSESMLYDNSSIQLIDELWLNMSNQYPEVVLK